MPNYAWYIVKNNSYTQYKNTIRDLKLPVHPFKDCVKRVLRHYRTEAKLAEFKNVSSFRSGTQYT